MENKDSANIPQTFPERKNYTPVSIKLVQELFGYKLSKSSVSRKIQLCRDALGKHAGAILTLEEFKRYNDLK